MGTEETLASEARGRPIAAWAAFLAVLATIATIVVPIVTFDSRETTGPLASIDAALRDGPVRDAPSQRLQSVFSYQDHFGGAIGVAIAQTLAYLLIGLVMYYLARFVRSRDGIGPAWVWLPLVGGLVAALSSGLNPLSRDLAYDEFLAGPRTVGAYDESESHPALDLVQVLGGTGSSLLGVAFAWVCFCAMRVGLLTRFMGVLGAICGLLVIVPLGAQLVIQTVWFTAFGLLLLGFWPGGVPPAWVTGRAEPWPTQQEVMEARARARAGEAPRPAGEQAPEPRREPAAVAAGAGTPHPSSKKKKRKRRA